MLLRLILAFVPFFTFTQLKADSIYRIEVGEDYS